MKALIATCWLLLVGAFGVAQAGSQVPSEILLRGAQWSARINPSTLAATAQRSGESESLPISLGNAALGKAVNVIVKDTRATWDLPSVGIHLSAAMQNERLSIEVVSDSAQQFTWPTLATTKATQGIVLPRGEGFYIPVRIKRWRDFASSLSPITTMEELTMPLWGIEYEKVSLTYVLTNPVDNSLAMEPKEEQLFLRLTHNFQSNYVKKQYGLVVMLGTTSPVEPALLYRKWLIENGQFVSLKDKLKKTPDLEKLFGAAHIYLWAGGVLDITDIHAWPALLTELRAPHTCAAKRVASLLPADVRQELGSDEPLSPSLKRTVLAALNEVIRKPDMYDPQTWPLETLPAELQLSAKAALSGDTSPAETAKLNACLLSASYPQSLNNCTTFGNGISPKMVQRLQAAGFDRLLLLVSDLDTLSLLPQTGVDAAKAGYLFGTYDSYHSIHSPDAKNTWPTAQFDQALFDNGAIIKANGERDHGFQDIGSHLSSIAVKPYFERRVDDWITHYKFNAYFIDCDGTGEFFDNYSKQYPATKQLDMQLRLDRLSWIVDKYHVVLGTEIGASFSAPVLHFGHGIMTPAFGWNDPQLHSRESPYFVGGYYPPDHPNLYFKSTVLPDNYKDIYFDPRYRLPLYQAAFHDSIITTHHWSAPSTKYANVLEINELLELLYGVPPLYHLNINELETRKQELQTHYSFFSPNYRRLALARLSDFQWLTDDHLVQKSEFGTEASIIANFRDTAFVYQQHTIQPHSVLLLWKSSGETLQYTSQYPADTIPVD